MSKFCERLRELRNKKGLSQQELADDASLSGSSICLYEHGEREPELDLLCWFANYFDVSVDFLLGRTDEAQSHTQEADTYDSAAAEIDPKNAYTGSERFTAVVELAKLTTKLMRASKRKPDDILRTVGAQLESFGVTLPEGFYIGLFTTEVSAERSVVVSQFLSEFGSVLDMSVGEVYNEYLDYCHRMGNVPISSTRAFGREVVKHTGVRTRSVYRNGKHMRVYICE